jgi:hypothetical protein
MNRADWSNGIRHHVFDTRSDAEFKLKRNAWKALSDGIPHLVFLDAAGRSEGQVVGKFPKQVLEGNVAAGVQQILLATSSDAFSM